MNRLYRFVHRRAPDLVVAGLVLGWVVACKAKKQTPPPAEPAALTTPNVAEAQPPATPPPPSRATIAGLEHVAAGECTTYADFGESMALARTQNWSALEPRIHDGALSSDAKVEWLVLAHHYQTECDPASIEEDTNARELVAAFVPLSEKLVDKELDEKRCGFLRSIDALEMWPYEVQFAQELQDRDFASAEITRMLWRDTISAYLDACGDKISRRQRVAGQARVTKLDRIIGLDDQVLIDLRSKMLTALEKGEADQIIAYSRAITDREKSIDSRNAELYEQKLRDVEAAVTMEKDEIAAAAATAPTSPATPAPAASTDKTADLARKTANVAAAAKNVQSTVKTAKQIGKLFGL